MPYEPSKNPAEDISCSVLLTKPEHDGLKALAKASGVPMRRWLRLALRELLREHGLL